MDRWIDAEVNRWMHVDVDVVCCTGKTVTGVGQGLDATVSGVGKTAGKYVPGRRVGGTVEGVTKGVGGTVSVLFLMIGRYNNTPPSASQRLQRYKADF